MCACSLQGSETLNTGLTALPNEVSGNFNTALNVNVVGSMLVASANPSYKALFGACIVLC